jgi:non-heme chloroperoxidase
VPVADLISPAASSTTGDESSCAGSSECRIALDTGITMAYREVGPSDGPAVILLHGFPDTGLAWSLVLPALTQRLPGYHLIIPDLRGLGESTLPAGPGCPASPATCFQPTEFARDIVAFMDARGISRASMVGHSVGTLVAQELGLNYPDRVDRLVLISTAATGQEPRVLAVRDQIIDGWWRSAFQAAGYVWPDDVYALNPSAAVTGYDDFVRTLLHDGWPLAGSSTRWSARTRRRGSVPGSVS